MAIQYEAVSVTTTATRLSAVEGGDRPGHSVQFTPPSAIYVGPAGVTTATGYLLTAGTEYVYDLDANESLYGVAASGTVVVPTLRVGV